MSNGSPLQILAICSRPLLDSAGQSIALLDVVEERRRIETAIERAGNVARVHFLPEATTGKVQTALRDGWDVVHFTGHGTIDGRILLEDGFGVAQYLTKQETARLFIGQQTPLVVLSACYSATVGSELHAAGVPAVVVVDARVPIADQAAIIFAEHFYGALTRGWDVRRAFEDAQRAVALDPKMGDAKPPKDAQGNTEEPWSQRFKLIGTAQGAPANAGTHRVAASHTQPAANLPTRSANFVGRSSEIVDVIKAFDETVAQRICIHGSGGLGKTELAKAVARWYMERTRVGAVLWASASHVEGEYKLRDLTSLLNIAARAFRLPITEQSMFDEQKRVVREFLTKSRALVLLDNWETIESPHRRELWNFVLSLVEPVHVLVTSRDVLPARDARNIEIETLAPKDAAELFMKTARNTGYFDRNAQPRTEEAAILDSICERLNGYPLAIEVVAGQTFSRTLSEILIDLQHVPHNVLEGKDELTGEPHGVWTSLDLSFNVISPNEQALFRQMGVFVGPASAEDIAAITETMNPQPVLDTLVKRSLVRMSAGAYSLLPIVRDYARGKLEDARQDPRTLYVRAVNYYGQKETIEGALTSSDYLFELAVRFESADAAEAFVGYLAGFYEDLITHSYRVDARNKAEQLIAVARALGDKQKEAQGIGELGNSYYQIGEYERATELHRKAYSIFEEIEDKDGVAAALHQLGALSRAQGNYDGAAQLYQQSLDISKELGDKRRVETTLGELGIMASDRGDYTTAEQLYRQSLKISEELGHKLGIAIMLDHLGGVQLLQGKPDEAMQLYRRSLPMQEALGYKSGIASSLKGLGDVEHYLGNHGEATRLYQQGLEIYKGLGDKWPSSRIMHQLGTLAQAQGDYSRAAQLYNQSLTIKEELGDKKGIAFTLAQLGLLARAQMRLKEALSYSLNAYLILEQLRVPSSKTAFKEVASLRDAVGKEQFATWLRELSAEEAERISELLERDKASA